MEFLDILKEYGGYIALPVIINAVMEGSKKGFKSFFVKSWGIRVAYFLPLVLGALGGLLLPLESIQEKVLIGTALGALSHYIYKFVTVTLASKSKMEYISGKKVEAKAVYKSLKGKVENEDVDEEVVDEDSDLDK